MFSHHLLLSQLDWLVLSIEFILAIPALITLRRRLADRGQRCDVYEDQDGRSTYELTKKFRNPGRKTIIVLLSVTGLAITSIGLGLACLRRGRPPTLRLWTGVAFWIVLVLEAVVIVISRDPPNTYRLGSYLTGSCIALVTIKWLLWTTETQNNLTPSPFQSFLGALEVVNALCLALSSISIPRRPEVFHHGKPVDRMLTDSALSHLTWSWATAVLRLAEAKNSLHVDDLPLLGWKLRAQSVDEGWRNSHHGGTLWINLVRIYKWDFTVQFAGSMVSAFLAVGPQWVMLQFLRFLGDGNQHHPEAGWAWVICIGVTIVLQTWVESTVFWLSWSRIALPVQSQLSSLIFQKALRLRDLTGSASQGVSADSNQQPSTNSTPQDLPGNQSPINLLGFDARRISEMCSSINSIPGNIARLLISFLFLADLLGWQALLGGCVIFVVLTPANMLLSKRRAVIQARLMRVRDKKTAVISEALRGIRQIKFSGHESLWAANIDAVRAKELIDIWASFTNDVLLLGCWVASPTIMAAVSLTIHATIYKELTPSVAFVSLGVFKSLEASLSTIPSLITQLLEARVSMRRIDDYLRSMETSKLVEYGNEISFIHASVAWPTCDGIPIDQSAFTLCDLNVTFPRGELSVISGETGSGKTLMLKAILGEAEVLGGAIYVPNAATRSPISPDEWDEDWTVPGAMAFVAQTPWVENASIRDNILFHLPFNKNRYYKTVRACALQTDLHLLIDGDHTEVGPSGVNLSGGQKWRITLARAIYSRAEILIMDDIFSAVDAFVGRHILDECLGGELCSGRTCILATHHESLCWPLMRYHVKLHRGVVAYAGLPLAAPIVSNRLDHPDIDNDSVTEICDLSETESETSDAEAETECGTLTFEADPDDNRPRIFVKQETAMQGAIQGRIYATFLRVSGGWTFWIPVILVFIVGQFVIIGRSWWLHLWTKSSMQTIVISDLQHSTYIETYRQHLTELSFSTTGIKSMSGFQMFMAVYVALALLSSLGSTLKYYYLFAGSVKGSRRLFTKSMFAVLHAPRYWLDTVPMGQILNRLTSDMNGFDTRLMYFTGFFFTALLNLITSVAASVAASPAVLLPFVVALTLVCFHLGVRYLCYSRSARRLESISRSPILDQLDSVLTGVATIRCFDMSSVYVQGIYEKIDHYTASSWYLYLFNRWMAWRVGLSGAVFACFVSGVLLYAQMDPALAGFTLTYVLEFSGLLMAAVRQYGNIEMEMNAAERIIEYSELPTESLGGKDAPAAWPTEGRLEACDLVAGYPDLPPTLKGLTFTINSGEKVGVVGRTGSGKSTLILSLFRFLEAQAGSIYIDGIDISSLKLRDIRSRITLIPQDPVLFKGTIRSNMDPLGEHSDLEILDALKRVRFINPDNSDGVLPRREASHLALLMPVAEGGQNLSHGQRQLLCLARAMISRTKIMVLDEASSAVDKETDTENQRHIRMWFQDRTMLVVAHRLSTVVNFDKILVLDQGNLVEFGTPRELWEIRQDRGFFRRLCEESEEASQLKEAIYGL
ncbi:P-loop containing nucleoside triphosphate hydrolase protein [Xylaria sp. FL0933]|nr:P-loop containing nucleoside triphosphate hydrolase protein [Xylaria sp. FL0933]